MSEKVLGFKEKDAWDDWIKDEPALKVEERKLVPVVSLEWLKEYCEKHKHYDLEGDIMVWADELIRTAEKQASQKAR